MVIAGYGSRSCRTGAVLETLTLRAGSDKLDKVDSLDYDNMSISDAPGSAARAAAGRGRCTGRGAQAVGRAYGRDTARGVAGGVRYGGAVEQEGPVEQEGLGARHIGLGACRLGS